MVLAPRHPLRDQGPVADEMHDADARPAGDHAIPIGAPKRRAAHDPAPVVIQLLLDPRGDRVESVVLEQALVHPPARVAEMLHLPATSLTVKVTRIRKVNGEPVLLETSFLPQALCPGLELTDLATHSLYARLEADYHLSLLYTEQTMEYVPANEYEQRVFALPAGAAMFLLEGVAFGEDDLPVEAFKAVYRADRCKFRLESRRNGLGAAMQDEQRIRIIVT